MPSEGDIDFVGLGIPEPTVEKHVTDDQVLEALARQRMEKHLWKQMGNELFCANGHPQHGFHVKTNQLFTGQDANGDPIFTTIEV